MYIYVPVYHRSYSYIKKERAEFEKEMELAMEQLRGDVSKAPRVKHTIKLTWILFVYIVLIIDCDILSTRDFVPYT